MEGKVEATDLSLWYPKPANPKKWEEALPIGNGRLGAMVFGGVNEEKLILNEDSLWSGWPEPKNDREGAYPALVKIRKLLQEGGDQEEVKKIAMDDFCSLHGYGKPDFGAYQAFFDTNLSFHHDQAKAVGYRRELNLKSAVTSVSYSMDGVDYHRELFCSYPDNVLVVRLSASQKRKIGFTLRVSSLHKNVRVAVEGDKLTLEGRVDTGSEEHPGMTFQGVWKVFPQGGEQLESEQGDALIVRDADAATLIMAGATNHRMKYPHYKGDPPWQRNERTLKAVKDKSFEELRSRHVEDFQEMFGRVDLQLDGPSRVQWPTDQRLAAYREDQSDRGLERLLFQYGRYLLMASSRPGSMPANLQGLWNHSNKPAWNCDYHLNINLQMNYWPVNSCNLAECAEPLIAWVEDITLPGAKSAKVHYHARGWVVHHTSNVWGFTPPGPNRGVHMLEAESGAFLCQNLWDVFAFTQDADYLKKVAWPILKGAAEFWMDNLQEVEGGYLAVSPSYSPEHGPLTDGASYQTMIVWDLFTHCIQAIKILGEDEEFADKLLQLRERLQPIKIGEYGQIQEWRDPNLEKSANSDQHRHVSHMYAVYPGKQIVPGRDEEFTDAAIRSMNFRGDGATGWSMGWKINLWARLLDGDHAHKLIQNLLSVNVYPNLWDKHPPFQIDGNFGYTAGVAEMLLQSHTGEIVLLPALPAAWDTGSVKGLCARGGFVVDMAWKDGALAEVSLYSRTARDCILRYRDERRTLTMKSGETLSFKGPTLR